LKRSRYKDQTESNILTLLTIYIVSEQYSTYLSLYYKRFHPSVLLQLPTTQVEQPKKKLSKKKLPVKKKNRREKMADQTKYSTSLANKRILVIGGSSGIGFCVAEACVEHGALVTIASSSAQRVEAAVQRIERAYPSACASSGGGKRRIWGTTVSLGSLETLEQELKRVLDTAVENMGGGEEDGKLDHVVYTAGDRLAEGKLGDMVCFFSSFFLSIHLSLSLPIFYIPTFAKTTTSG
jgi:hypothetical protein